MSVNSETPASVIDKVKKLLALSLSANEHEAARAAEKAAELMKQWNLNRLELENMGQADKEVYTHEVVGRDFMAWHRHIAHEAARNNYCEMILVPRKNDKGREVHGKWDYEFIGQPSNLEVAKYIYTYLVREIQRLAAKAWSDLDPYAKDVQTSVGTTEWKWRKAFETGAANTVRAELAGRRKREEAATAANERALIVVRERDLLEAYNHFFPARGASKSASRNWLSDAYTQGREAGRNVSITTPINAPKPMPKSHRLNAGM